MGTPQASSAMPTTPSSKTQRRAGAELLWSDKRSGGQIGASDSADDLGRLSVGQNCDRLVGVDADDLQVVKLYDLASLDGVAYRENRLALGRGCLPPQRTQCADRYQEQAGRHFGKPPLPRMVGRWAEVDC